MAPSGCCGSSLQYPHTRQAPPFTRKVTGPTIDSRVVHSQRKDITPPSRISDLIAWVNSSTGRVILEWTAVGNDFDWGYAFKYEGAVTTSIEEAATSCTGRILQGLPKPLAAASRESISISLDLDEKKTLYVCLRSIDKSGNKGPPSNPAAVWLPRPPSIDRVTVRARGSGFSSYASSGVGEKAAVISGCIGGVLLVVIIVAAYCYCVPATFKRRFKVRRRDPKGNKEEDKPRNGSERNLINGGSIIMKSSSRKSVFTANANDSDRNEDKVGNETFRESTNEVGPSARGSRNAPDGGSQETLRMSMEINGGPVNNEAYSEAQGLNNFMNSEGKSFSLSIPDVTKVDLYRPNNSQNENIPTIQPQFFTLGRRSHQNSSNENPYFDTCRAGFQQQPLQHSIFEKSKEHRSEAHIIGESVSQPTTVGTLKSPFRPTTPTQHCRQSLHESDSSLYGSQEGDSVMDVLLCDDRTASPPPPAPSGPEISNSTVSFRLKRHSVGFP